MNVIFLRPPNIFSYALFVQYRHVLWRLETNYINEVVKMESLFAWKTFTSPSPPSPPLVTSCSRDTEAVPGQDSCLVLVGRWVSLDGSRYHLHHLFLQLNIGDHIPSTSAAGTHNISIFPGISFIFCEYLFCTCCFQGKLYRGSIYLSWPLKLLKLCFYW